MLKQIILTGGGYNILEPHEIRELELRGNKKMVDTSKSNSNYLTAAMVLSIKKKNLIINTEPDYEETKFGAKLTCKAQFGGAEVTWRINPKTQSFISMKYGGDSKDWVGKVINLEVKDIQGNDTIIGVPE